MDTIIYEFSRQISTSGILAPILALLGGILTSLSPCSLATVPLIIGFVGGKKSNTHAFLLSLTFVLGTAFTFTILGVFATITGRLFGTMGSTKYFLLALLAFLMALQSSGKIKLIPTKLAKVEAKGSGFPGAFLTGLVGGLFSSPCATPMLVAVLAMVAGQGSLIWGGILLLFYSLGNGIIALLAGTFSGLLGKMRRDEKYRKFSQFVQYMMTGFIVLLGIYFLYLAF